MLGFISFNMFSIISLFSGARYVFFPFFSIITVSYGIFRVNGSVFEISDAEIFIGYAIFYVIYSNA